MNIQDQIHEEKFNRYKQKGNNMEVIQNNKCNPADLIGVYVEPSVYVVREQLYPESRGYVRHEFDSLFEAEHFEKTGEKLSSLKAVLMERDCISSEDEDIQIREAREALAEYLAEGDNESAQNICEECFGLEPDYLIDLM